MTTEIKIPDALDDVRISVFENATSTKPRTSASIHVPVSYTHLTLPTNREV